MAFSLKYKLKLKTLKNKFKNIFLMRVINQFYGKLILCAKAIIYFIDFSGFIHIFLYM